MCVCVCVCVLTSSLMFACPRSHSAGVRLGFGTYLYVNFWLSFNALALPVTPRNYALFQISLCSLTRLLNAYWSYLIISKVACPSSKPSKSAGMPIAAESVPLVAAAADQKGR